MEKKIHSSPESSSKTCHAEPLKKNTHQISTKKLSSTSSSLLAPCKRLPWKPRHVGPTPHWCWTNSPLVLDPWASKNMLTESSAPEEIAASAHSWMPEKELMFFLKEKEMTQNWHHDFKQNINETLLWFKTLFEHVFLFTEKNPMEWFLFIEETSWKLGAFHQVKWSTPWEEIFHHTLTAYSPGQGGWTSREAPDLQVLLNVFTIIVIWLKDIERHVSKVQSHHILFRGVRKGFDVHPKFCEEKKRSLLHSWPCPGWGNLRGRSRTLSLGPTLK